MKKILFNDKFGLTKAVLEGRKTQTRRICEEQVWAHSDIVNAENGIFHFEIPKYKVGEIVAVVQSYETISNAISKTESKEKAAFYCKVMKVCFPDAIIHKDKEEIAGWYNKMFTRAELMPRQIRITDVRVERLQDISDEDCLKEGVVKDTCKTYFNGYTVKFSLDQYNNILSSEWFRTPREAFANLINKVSRKDVWSNNPYVFVYDFELVIMENKLVAFITSTSFLDVDSDLSGYEFAHGTHNGYVAVPPENKYHGRNINDMEDFEVHGGITLSEPATYPDKMNGMEIKKEYVGKRNELLEKAEFITENTEIGDDWWIFGFDTAHWGDNKYDWDRQAVIEETLSMMEQLNRE